MAKNKVKKRITHAKIQFLSLCPRGANDLETIYKSDDGESQHVTISSIIKEGMSEQGEIIAVVYAPDREDSEGHKASAAVIKEMAYDFATNGQGVDIRHNGVALAKEDIFVAQSFIISKGDERFSDIKNYDGDVVDVSDGWGVVLKVEKEELRKQYRDGAWKGISMGGFGTFEDIKEDADEVRKFSNIITKIFEKVAGTSLHKEKDNDSETEMKPEELQDLINKTAEKVVSTLKESGIITKEEKKEDKKEEKKLGMGWAKPILKEKASPEEIDTHLKKMRIWELSEAVDKTSVESIHSFQTISKAIAEGKEVEIKKASDPMESFFKTTQTGNEINKDSSEQDPYAEAILKSYEKKTA